MPRLAAKNGVILNLAAVLVFAGGCLALHQLATQGAYAAEPLRRLRRVITSTTAPKTPVTTTSVESGAVLLLNEGFEAGKVGAGWTGFAMYPRTPIPEDSDSIDIVTDPVRKGNYALRIVVQPEDAVTDDDKRLDKERCEFVRLNACRDGVCTFGDEGREGSEIWYAWSLMIPTDYQFVSTTAENYQIMGQWHDQPAPGLPPTGYSPPISVHYRSNGAIQGLQVRYGLLQTGGAITTLDTPIQKGTWVDLMLHIRFSQGSGGFLEAWKDGVLLTSATGATRLTGPNMFNAEPDYLRLGLYRGKGQAQTDTIYYDEIKIATTKAALLAP